MNPKAKKTAPALALSLLPIPIGGALGVALSDGSWAIYGLLLTVSLIFILVAYLANSLNN